jgi:hypothetical protein
VASRQVKARETAQQFDDRQRGHASAVGVGHGQAGRPIRHNPADGLALPRRECVREDDHEDVKALSREQLAALLRAAPERYRLLLELMASRAGMRRFTSIAVAIGCLLLPGSAHARTFGVPCRSSTGAIIFKVKPRTCTFGGRYGYQQVDFTRIRWRSWGGRSAFGRGTEVGNMGARARVRFMVYRPRFCEGDLYAYTQLRNFTSGWRMRLRWRC